MSQPEFPVRHEKLMFQDLLDKEHEMKKVPHSGARSRRRKRRLIQEMRSAHLDVWKAKAEAMDSGETR